MSTSADKIMIEARAKAIWGESVLSVRDFLISNGVPEAIAKASVKEFESERNRELRRLGIRNVLIGSVLTCAAGGTLYLALPVASATSGIVKALVVVLLAGIYGVWKLMRGVFSVIRPESEHRAIPDINHADPLE